MSKLAEVSAYSRHIGFLHNEMLDAATRWQFFRFLLSGCMLISSACFFAKAIDVAVSFAALSLGCAVVARLEKKRAMRVARIYGRATVKLNNMLR